MKRGQSPSSPLPTLNVRSPQCCDIIGQSSGVGPVLHDDQTEGRLPPGGLVPGVPRPAEHQPNEGTSPGLQQEAAER